MNDDFLNPSLETDSNLSKKKSKWGVGRQILNGVLTAVGLGAVGVGGYFLYELNFSGQNLSVMQNLLWQKENIIKPATASAEAKTIKSKTIKQKAIYIDVSGAVNQPGLKQLPAESRVAAAVKAADGLAANADQAYATQELNLAQKLVDGQKLYFPTQAEKEYAQTLEELCSQAQTQVGQEGSSTETGLISINQASVSQLEELPQIGEKRTEDIISGRPYQSLQDLVTKEVVTENIFSKIEDLIKL